MLLAKKSVSSLTPRRNWEEGTIISRMECFCPHNQEIRRKGPPLHSSLTKKRGVLEGHTNDVVIGRALR